MIRRVIQCAALLAVVAGFGLVTSDADACLFCHRPRCTGCYAPVVYQAYYVPAPVCCDPCTAYYGSPSPYYSGGAYYAPYAPVPTYSYSVPAVAPAYYAGYPGRDYRFTSRVKIRSRY